MTLLPPTQVQALCGGIPRDLHRVKIDTARAVFFLPSTHSSLSLMAQDHHVLLRGLAAKKAAPHANIYLGLTELKETVLYWKHLSRAPPGASALTCLRRSHMIYMYPPPYMTCVCHVSLSGKRATGRADSKGVLTLWVANCDASVFFPFFSPIPLFNCRLCGMCPPPLGAPSPSQCV